MINRFENAAQAIEWINGLRYAGEKNGLENMRALLGRLGHPEKGLKMIHVAGTNGKGSTCAMVERMLRGCGLKTGLYTSPYLMRFNERMRVNGAPIPDEALVRLTERVRFEAEALLEIGVKPTTFELGTAIVLKWFAEEEVDAAVIEVGLGGRFDPTNVISPKACLIASIGMDHTKMLGDTLEKIAFEKAGIIKAGVPAAVGVQQSEDVMGVFRRAAMERNAPLAEVRRADIRLLEEDERGSRFLYKDMPCRIRLAGRHQVENACLALSGMELLRNQGFDLPWEKCVQALERAVWPGRLEWLEEGLLIDGAHNPQGAKALAEYARRFLPGRRVVPVIGMMKDKDVDACVEEYAAVFSRAVATQVDYPRAMPAEQLKDMLLSRGVEAVAATPVVDAVERARTLAGEGGIVLVCGSLYVVGEARAVLHNDDGRL